MNSKSFRGTQSISIFLTLFNFIIIFSRQVLQWWELLFLWGGQVWDMLAYIYTVSSPTYNFLRGGIPKCLSHSTLYWLWLYKFTPGWDPCGFFPTVVILLLPLHKKFSTQPQIFEQSLFLSISSLTRLFWQGALSSTGAPYPIPPVEIIQILPNFFVPEEIGSKVIKKLPSETSPYTSMENTNLLDLQIWDWAANTTHRIELRLFKKIIQTATSKLGNRKYEIFWQAFLGPFPAVFSSSSFSESLPSSRPEGEEKLLYGITKAARNRIWHIFYFLR